MKLTNNQIYSLVEAIGEFQKQNFELPVRVGFKILKNLQALQPTYEIIVNMRDGLIQKYSKPGEELSEESISAINTELYELGLEEQEISIQPINLKDIEHLNLSFNLLAQLQFLIKDED